MDVVRVLGNDVNITVLVPNVIRHVRVEISRDRGYLFGLQVVNEQLGIVPVDHLSFGDIHAEFAESVGRPTD